MRIWYPSCNANVRSLGAELGDRRNTIPASELGGVSTSHRTSGGINSTAAQKIQGNGDKKKSSSNHRPEASLVGLYRKRPSQ